MNFVKATAADKEEILQLYHNLAGTEFCTWTLDYPNEKHIEDDLSRDALFCCKDMDGNVIGVISIDQDENVENLPCWTDELRPSAELSRLGVRVENQNRGVARKLLQYGMEELRRRGNKSVHFLVSKTNEKAKRSYDKLNFDIVGECELFGEAWWCYEKCLASEVHKQF